MIILILYIVIVTFLSFSTESCHCCYAGLPPVQNDYDPALGKAADALALKWHTSDLLGIGSKGPTGASPSDIQGWSSEMLVAFLDKLASYRARQPMHKQTTRQMAKLYSLDESKNAEIRGSWYKLAVNAGRCYCGLSVIVFLLCMRQMGAFGLSCLYYTRVHKQLCFLMRKRCSQCCM